MPGEQSVTMVVYLIGPFSTEKPVLSGRHLVGVLQLLRCANQRPAKDPA